MSDQLRNNLTKVAFNTVFDTEKVVKQLQGSFVIGTDTINRPYNFFGAYTIPVFRIEHGYTRPVFTELIWSPDNSTFLPGGGNQFSTGDFCISFSDSQYVYIMPIGLSAPQEIFYRLAYVWIEDYDDTNPSVGGFNFPANFTQVLNSRAQIPSVTKQEEQSFSTDSATFTNVTQAFNHGYGYAPDFRIYFESFAGEVWQQHFGGSNNPFLVDQDQVECVSFSDTDDLIVSMVMKASNNTRKAWYQLYGKTQDNYSEAPVGFAQL